MKRLAMCLLLGTGCSAPEDGTCADVIVAGRHPESGAVRVEYDGIARAYDLTDVPANEGSFDAGGEGNRVGDDGDVALDYHIAFISHRPSLNAVGFGARFGDVRELGEGDVVPAYDGSGQFAPTCAGCNYRCNSLGLSFEIEVLEATGTSAPYPDVVTPDFHRRLKVHSLSDRLVDRSLPGCTTVYFELLVEVVIDATDFTIAQEEESCQE